MSCIYYIKDYSLFLVIQAYANASLVGPERTVLFLVRKVTTVLAVRNVASARMVANVEPMTASANACRVGLAPIALKVRNADCTRVVR